MSFAKEGCKLLRHAIDDWGRMARLIILLCVLGGIGIGATLVEHISAGH